MYVTHWTEMSFYLIRRARSIKSTTNRARPATGGAQNGGDFVVENREDFFRASNWLSERASSLKAFTAAVATASLSSASLPSLSAAALSSTSL